MTLEQQWSEIPLKVRDYVYGKLISMKIGEEYLIKKIQPEQREAFVTVVKYHIKWNEGITFQIVFSNDYLKIKKY